MASFLYLIPARKGSLRLKNKNILKIKKKTLIQRTIEFAKKISTKKDKILVSTDSILIKKISLNNKILCPWLRPNSLSGNKVSSEKVIVHAIKWYKKHYKLLPDGIILLQPTTPFRSISHFRKCINKFSISNKSIISVKNVNTVFKDIYFKKKNNLKILKEHDFFIPNGSMYILNTHDFLKFKSINKIKKSFFEMNGRYNLDIDYPHQYLLANQIASK